MVLYRQNSEQMYMWVKLQNVLQEEMRIFLLNVALQRCSGNACIKSFSLSTDD